MIKLSNIINLSEFYNSNVKNFKHLIDNCSYKPFFLGKDINKLSSWNDYYYPKDAIITTNPSTADISFTDEGGTKSYAIDYLFKPYQGSNAATDKDNINSFELNNNNISISSLNKFDVSLVKNQNNYTLNITSNENRGYAERSDTVVINAKGLNNGNDASFTIKITQERGRTNKIPVTVNIKNDNKHFMNYNFAAVIEIYLNDSSNRIETQQYIPSTGLPESSATPYNYLKYGPNNNYLSANTVGASIDMRCMILDQIDEKSSSFVYDCSMYYKTSTGDKKFVTSNTSKITAKELTFTASTITGALPVNPLGMWANGDHEQLLTFNMTPPNPISIGTRQYGGDDFAYNVNIYEIIFDITI